MSEAASWPRAVAAQSASEARLTLRRGENVLAMVGIPIAALLAAGALGGGGLDAGQVLAGTLSLAIVASGLVNLCIATAYERGYGVLKRLGGSPLGRSGLVTSKILVVVAIAALQVAGLLVVATLLGWPVVTRISLLVLAVATVVGAVTFAGLGLAIAGLLRPEAVLVVANVLFLLALLFGGPIGAVVPLPEVVVDAARFLPSGALAEAFSAGLGASGADLARALVALAGWAAVGAAVATRTFRWE